MKIWLRSIKRQKSLHCDTYFSPKHFCYYRFTQRPFRKTLWDCWTFEDPLNTWRGFFFPRRNKSPSTCFIQNTTGKSEKSNNPMRKTQAGISGCKVRLCCSRNFMWNTLYQAGLICLVNKRYMTHFYVTCVLEAF